MARAHIKAHSTTHDDAFTPCDNWLAVGVDQIITFVLKFKKSGTEGFDFLTEFISHDIMHGAYVTTSTERFLALPFQEDTSNTVVFLPAFEFLFEQS